MDLSILDRPLRAIKQVLRGEPFEPACVHWADLEDISDWQSGLENNASEYVAPLPDPLVIRNIMPGAKLHLGDGRSLEFGEEARVSAELASLLRERGQAE